MPAAQPFLTQITIRASARRAFDAFTDPARQSRWYSGEARFSLRVGERGQFEWNERREAFDEFWTVAEFKTGSLLKFGWENFGRFGGLHARVAARFIPLGRDRMRLELRHTLVRDPEDKVADYKARWQSALAALKELLEG